jgi:DeoR/GlpR family transcriptional regulator of sugar metabolism
MRKQERQEKILKLLEKGEKVYISQLANEFGVSPITVRRDLESLQNFNLIKKVHGGAVSAKNNQVFLAPFYSNLENNKEKKLAIAIAATQFIKPRNVICLDSGTTTFLISELLPHSFPLKVITTSLITSLNFLQFSHVEVIQSGGLVHPESYSATDFLATEFLKKFKADMAFMTATAFRIPHGAFDANVSLVESKRMFANISKKVIMLLDSTKFDRDSLCLSVPLQSIHTIITDDEVPQNCVDYLVKIGKEVIIVNTRTNEIIQHLNKN